MSLCTCKHPQVHFSHSLAQPQPLSGTCVISRYCKRHEGYLAIAPRPQECQAESQNVQLRANLANGMKVVEARQSLCTDVGNDILI